MKNLILSIFVLSLSAIASAQNKGDVPSPPPPAPPLGSVTTTQTSDKTYTYVEQAPDFPGGQEALYKYLSENIEYPKDEKENGIYGTVFVSFVVSKTGEIVDVRIARGVKGGEGLSQEAMRVVKEMPKWTPGKIQNQPVAVQFNLPIKFELRDSK